MLIIGKMRPPIPHRRLSAIWASACYARRIPMFRHQMYQHSVLRRLLQLMFAGLVVGTFVACQMTGGTGSDASPTASATFAPTPTPPSSPTPSPFPSPTPTPTVTLAQRIDAYIAHLDRR